MRTLPYLLSVLRRTLFKSALPEKFLQSAHLQLPPQRMPAWKHSQYFFRQPDFLQLQPLQCATGSSWRWTGWILGIKACGLRYTVASAACCRAGSWSAVFWQHAQLQSRQYRLLAKQGQYSFRQRDFLQLQAACSVGRSRGDGMADESTLRLTPPPAAAAAAAVTAAAAAVAVTALGVGWSGEAS